MTVGVLALAAGSGRRFGSDKRQAPLADGRTVLDTFLDSIDASDLPVLVCLGCRDDKLAAKLAQRVIDFYQCHNAPQGMGATLAEGVGQLPNWDGVLIALADMPWVKPETYRELAEGLTHRAIHIPVYEGRRGHPVGFGSDYFPALQQLSGNAGARQLTLENAEQVIELSLQDPGIHRDIDEPGDLPGQPD